MEIRRQLATLLLGAIALVACGSSGGGTTTGPAPDGAADAVAQNLPPRLANAPSALDNPSADGLPSPTIDLTRLRSGGPPPDGIPPIDEPNYTVATAVDFLDDVEPVLVVAVEGETKIFPVQILTWHEIVNDTIGGVPVTVSYCPLCNSAITYDRRIDVDGTAVVLDFGTSGMLYNSALVMYDRQSESLWSHFSASAIAGVLAGTTLETFPTSTVGWATARDALPDAEVLNRDTGHSRRYGENPYRGDDDVSSFPFLFDGDVDGRLTAKTRVIGIRSGEDAVAVRTEALPETTVVDVELDGRAITVWRAPGTASALDTTAISEGRDVGATGVFDRTVDGRRLTFAVDGGGFVDAETGTRWNILGAAVDGPLAGSQLDAITHVDTFWFVWAAFLPDTRVVPAV